MRSNVNIHTEHGHDSQSKRKIFPQFYKFLLPSNGANEKLQTNSRRSNEKVNKTFNSIVQLKPSTNKNHPDNSRKKTI